MYLVSAIMILYSESVIEGVVDVAADRPNMDTDPGSW